MVFIENVKKEIQKDFPPVPSSFVDRLILKVHIALINARTPHLSDIPFPLRSIFVTLVAICFSVSLWSLISFYVSSWTIITFLVFVGLSNLVVFGVFRTCLKIEKFVCIHQKRRILRFTLNILLSLNN